MHLDDAESELLKKWIIKKLEDISDADSDVLADYVLALVKTDDAEAVAKANCVENLKDFLLDNTQSFVDLLFLVIKTKSFDPTKPPPKPAAQVYQPPKRPSFEKLVYPNQSKKRSYHDWDREGNANGHIQSYDAEQQPTKQARRGNRRQDVRGGKLSQTQLNPFDFLSSQNSHLPKIPTPPPGMASLDMETLLAMQQGLGFFPGMPNGTSSSNANGFSTGRRCRDYDTKGFCAKGASCPFEHGNDTYVFPGSRQEYDPTHASLFNITPSRIGQFDASNGGRIRGGARGRARGRGNWRGGGKRSDFAQAGPNRDKSITSIVVEQIPEENCNESSVREFFSEFGSISDITIQSVKKLAVVHFDSNDAAQAAYDSPKVVFDNRFVKVYWYKPEKMERFSNGPGEFAGSNKNSDDVEMQEDEQIDLEEVAKRQDEAQRKHEEAKKQREAAEKQRQDLDAKAKAMAAERKKLDDALAKKSGKAVAPDAEDKASNGEEESEKTKALKAQLAKLEAEAKSLGIDTEDAPTNGYSHYSPNYRSRGGYRGRGRGRGYFGSPRGGWAGAGGRGGAVMRLDNRPKTVAVTFAQGSYNNHDEALRQFLLFNSMDSATLTKHPDREDTALVAFSQRYEGENFMAAAGRSELPHIGKAELWWYKSDSTAGATNGFHDEVKIEVSESSENPSSEMQDETLDAAEDEDLDRWA